MQAVVNISFNFTGADFGDNRRQELLYHLSVLAGCDLETISIVGFTKGCWDLALKIGNREAHELMEALKADGEATITLTKEQVHSLKEVRKEFDLASFRMMKPKPRKAESLSVKPGKLFFIHGWTGGEETFERFPEYIQEITGCTPVPYHYPSNLTRHSSPISFVARNFDTFIANTLYDDPQEFGIIAHSMGGVVTRTMLSGSVWRRNQFRHLLKTVVFIASPQSGTWWANFARYVPGSAFRQSQELRPGSPFLSEVSSNWNQWIQDECDCVDNVKSVLTDTDQVVPVTSSVGSDGSPVVILGRSHKNIVKPKSKEDEVVKSVSRFILDAGMGKRNE
ncbi:MAG: hypothetical protein AAF382_05220 [Pseudomonadota bacterium]